MVSDIAIHASSMVFGVLMSSFMEYATHRYMHWSTSPYCPLGVGHRLHHATEHMPFLQEFLHYSVGLIIAALVLYNICPQEYLSSFYFDSMAWATAYIAFAAYSHTVQHENPTMCTWMKMPVHYVHHEGNMWRHNFGIGVDWWDRVFGTYKEFDWCTPDVLQNAKHDRLDISWFYLKKGGKRI